MSIFGSWVVTAGFFFGVFLIGKALQYKEKRDRQIKRAEEALRRDIFYVNPATPGPPTLGTRYGDITDYERRQATR